MATLTDHRGRTHPVSFETLHRDARTPLASARHIFAAVFTLILFPVLWLASSFLPPSPWRSLPWNTTVPLLGGVAIGLFVERWVSKHFYTRKSLTKHAAFVVALNRCPVCWYDLTAAKPEPDGCRVCPECGAAWHPHPPSPNPRPAQSAAAQPQSEIEQPRPQTRP